jgi:uncharacterized protein (TIGR03435 family)
MTSAVVNHLWQSTVGVLVAALVVRALRRHQARVRHAVWLAASLKFLLPFSLLIGLGAALSWTSAPPADIQPPAFVETVQTIAEPFAGPSVEPEPTIAAPAPVAIPWFTILAMAWIGGGLVVVATRVRGWVEVRNALRASVPATLPRVDGSVRVRATPGLFEPAVVGIRHPVLLVPVDLDATLSAAQLEAIVAHELQHVRRRDNLTSALHMAVEAVFWFHPLVWWIGTRLVDECERACDEHVIASGTAPADYAEAILTVCKRYVDVPVACAAGVTGSDLKKRLNTILAGRVGLDLSVSRRTVIALAAVAALVAPVAAGVITAPLRSAPQTSNPIAKFDVVSVRPCAPDAQGQKRGGGPPITSPGRLYLECYPLSTLFQEAYIFFAEGRAHALGYVSRFGVEGGPDWMKSDRYTIEARTDQNPPAAVMRGPMLQAVLADRFKLKVRRETREMPIYELVTAKSGAKVSPYTGHDCVIQDDAVWPPVAPPAGQSYCRDQTRRPEGDLFVRTGVITLDWLADSFRFDHPVVNRTGITAPVSLRLEYPVPDPGSQDAPPPATLMRALRDQLGLDLRPSKGPREFLVIEHAEKPSSNDTTANIRAAGPPSLPPSPKFEVVSVRPCDPGPQPAPSGGRGGGAAGVSPQHFFLGCRTVINMIGSAYTAFAGGHFNEPSTRPIFDKQHAGPDWARSEMFTIEATTSVATPPIVMQGPMLQAVLEDRFKLRMHRETREVAVYELVVAKGGAKVKPFQPGSCVPWDWNYWLQQPALEPGQHRCTSAPQMDSDGNYVQNVEAMTLDDWLADDWVLMGAKLPVINKTGITGLQTFRFVSAAHWLDDTRTRMRADTPEDRAAEFRKQLGLDLRPGRGPHEFLILDSVEHPTPDGPLPSLRQPR